MNDNFAIQLFEGKKVRFVWDEEQEKYYFAIVDIVQVLTDSADYQTARKYWKVLKGRLLKEGNETVTNCYQLKLPAADGKRRKTQAADLKGILAYCSGRRQCGKRCTADNGATSWPFCGISGTCF
ncbi:MAG: hypothetical protein IJP70_09665 [Bacteroidales bacterium]|nr:hypothetical protein [Bacteroidales bacterium]